MIKKRSATALSGQAWRSAAVALAAAITGCSLLTSPAESDHTQWSRDGVLALSRSIPELGDRPATSLPPMLGFLPNKHSHVPSSIVIHRASGSLTLSVNNDTARTIVVEGASSLRSGVYTLVLKQTDPLWYAPESYFSNRGLPIPGEGDRERFRRGALGSQVLFFDRETPIHSGPLWSQEIGGVQIDPESMASLFEAIQVGAQVEVL